MPYKNVGVIIQARLGSTRFPKKHIKKLGSIKVIDWVIDRIKLSKKIKKIILATTNLKEDKILIKIAKNKKIDFFCGESENVLKRFCFAAKKFSLNTVVRVCADNPFISYEFIEQLIEYYNERSSDLVFNHQSNKELNYKCVNGFGAEIISTKLLNKIANTAKQKKYLEHVTKYIYDNKEKFVILGAPLNLIYKNSKIKLDINYKKDLLKLNKLVNKYKFHIQTPAKKIIQTLAN